LFVGEAGASERNAILYTVIEICRRRGIDPYAYLKDALTRLPSMTNRQLVVLLPANWGRKHIPALKAAA
jgi:urate oxidase